ncbi:tRNA pseudouridine(55) synthase TruB [Clostridium sp. cel8]|uniref:tRNA pseudouridine(55) synthase TruB n=1 Tax=Clostridium sp. cel8 TaxID=2663123 RepID=UPI0015F725F9|nr:tRNA pseudouridine(55) synthase TruB [Clostridium sp. cel8]MBA5850455.1 tRNA pseudouridine(55) synthase TruB [Clostridium sp. cel8]
MNGILNINKPKGMTSFDVVKKVKSICNMKRVGHTGTLDPGASGVLPICIGRATKLVDYIMEGSKTYVATLKLGVVTDTYDKYGKIVFESNLDVNEKEIIDSIMSFKGNISQIPPMYSALKVNGKRLYELARKGIKVERKTRNITIYSIDILKVDLPYVKFEVKCSKGTYIRSLCHDIGQKLGCGGTMWELLRTHSGGFDISDSISVLDLNEVNVFQHLIPMDMALEGYPCVHIEDNFKKHVLNGLPIKSNKFLNKIEEDVLYRVYIDKNKFIGIGMNKKGTGFKMKKLLISG